MNEILQNIMLFINNHTLLLIGICVFLILVLVGYLIDNSVKSKRVRKDIKNADQVPENIKDEIIKQAEEKAIIKEDTTPALEPTQQENVQEVNQEPIQTEQVPEELNNPLNLDGNQTMMDQNDQGFNAEALYNEYATPTLDFGVDVQNNQISQVDPDAAIMNQVNSSEYKNDKSLSEILSNVETKVEENDNNIFSTNEPNIVINNDVEKNDVQIENNDSSDELDRIMRKLSTMNNNVQDDNYTNIF